MNKPLASMIATLLVFPLGAVAAQTAGDDIATPQSASAVPVTAVSAGVDNASTDKPVPEPASDTVTPQPAGAGGEAQIPAATTETEQAPAAAKAPGPITSAFGIPLGEHFEASMVTRVLDEQEQIYSGQGGTKLKGTLLRVEPSEPDERFQRYSLKTTDDGIVYAIRGDYQFEVEAAKGKQAGKVKTSRALRKRCKDVVKGLATELEASYGKPRGKGWDGEWFAFRQSSDTANKSLRLYAHRCRTGMYSVIYTDEKVQRGTVPGKASTSPEASTPPTGSVPAKQEPGTESGSQTEQENM
jgi:hypothetical protein